MHPSTKVILRGRSVKSPTVRYKNGVRQVLHLIFEVRHPNLPHRAPSFVAEAICPIRWARTTRAQWRRRRVSSWLRMMANAEVQPQLIILEEVWVPAGTRRSSRLAWWVRKLRPTLQGTLGRGDPDVHLHNTLKESPERRGGLSPPNSV